MTSSTPLAELVRPKTLAEFFGQEQLIKTGSFLERAIKNDTIPSLIFWGPPGSGKTTLAHIIAGETKGHFSQISAVSSGKKDLLAILEKSRALKSLGQKTILFIDEIHRWNKAQQDALLPFVEQGVVTLIGATTENPSFEVISALLSRARVLVLKKLSKENILAILKQALSKIKQSNLPSPASLPKTKKTTQKPPELNFEISEEILLLISRFANGDARTALNILDACLKQNRPVTPELIKEILQKSHLLYDKNGEEHYNIISALHKSMRGGDANAAIYWLARMLEGGEDPIYIARRLLRFAGEDVGLGDNHAIVLANAVFDACHKLGMPECNVHLTQCVIYL